MFFIAIEDGFYCATGGAGKTSHLRWATPFTSYEEAHRVAKAEVMARKNATYFCILSSAPYQHSSEKLFN